MQLYVIQCLAYFQMPRGKSFKRSQAAKRRMVERRPLVLELQRPANDTSACMCLIVKPYISCEFSVVVILQKWFVLYVLKTVCLCYEHDVRLVYVY